MSLQCETDSTVEQEMLRRRNFEAQDLKLTATWDTSGADLPLRRDPCLIHVENQR